jgi:acyl carrier protein
MSATPDEYKLVGKLLVLTSITIVHEEITELLERIQQLSDPELVALEASTDEVLNFLHVDPVVSYEDLSPSEDAEEELQQLVKFQYELTKEQRERILNFLEELDDDAFSVDSKTKLSTLNLSDIDCAQIAMSLEDNLDREIDETEIIRIVYTEGSTVNDIFEYLNKILKGETNGKL